MKKYQNKEWLYKKYWEEELSQRQIARLCEVSKKTIRRWLKKFNISCRSCSEGQHLIRSKHCNLSERAIEWISGELLGDGCLYSASKYSALFKYSSKYLEYVNYVSDTLGSFGIEQTGKINKRERENAIEYSYNSRSYDELSLLRNKWYLNYKKIVPKDIELTPLVCRQWYIGDGYLNHWNKNPSIKLCTNGFIISNVNFLIQRLNKSGFKATRQQSLNMIGISTHSTKAFLDYIGECPVKCYEYKFEY